MPIWNNSQLYTIGEEVTYDDILYVALTEIQYEIPENSIHWMMVWEDDVDYEIGEIVRHGTEEYQLIKTAPTGTYPTDTTYWTSYDTLLIKGDSDKIYNLDEIFQSKDRMSDGALLIPTTNDDLREGSIMIQSSSAKRKLKEPIIEWSDFKKRLKR